MMGIVVSAQKRLARLAAQIAANTATDVDTAEFAADVDYRLCLMELGITEDELGITETGGSVVATAQSAGTADKGGETV